MAKSDQKDDEESSANNTLQGYYVGEDAADYLNGDSNISADDLLTTDMNGIFGLPYQFMDTVDRRVEGTEFGRKYAEKIISRMPLLYLTPGKQLYFDEFNDEDSQSLFQSVLGSVMGENVDAEAVIGGEGRYYSFGFDYTNYFRYVNTMAWSVAYYMGIADEYVTIGGKRRPLWRYDWSNAQSSAFQSYFSSSNNIIFYVNGYTEVSESFSNSTMESSLASTINGMSDQVKEIASLIGSNSVIGALGDSISSSTMLSSIQGILGEGISAIGGGVLGSLCTTGVDTVLAGGKIIFPELWQDSSYTTSYNVDIKLRSPDNDPVSLYLNILIPYIHLLAMVLPKGTDEYDPNAFTSPFLCRAFMRGMFNVDMGLITSMSVTKGGEQNWNDNGIPSQIDINLEIEDLYPGLFMTPATEDTDISSKSHFNVDKVVNNTAYMDFLGNMAGLNLAQPELLRKAKFRVFLTRSVIADTPARLGTRFENFVVNKIRKLWNIL